MASKTSVISLFVLVLATYCYSLPIDNQYLSSTLPTPSNEFSTGITIVDHDVKVNMRVRIYIIIFFFLQKSKFYLVNA